MTERPNEPSLIPTSEKIYQIKEKNYVLSDANYDIGSLKPWLIALSNPLKKYFALWLKTILISLLFFLMI